MASFSKCERESCEKGGKICECEKREVLSYEGYRRLYGWTCRVASEELFNALE